MTEKLHDTLDDDFLEENDLTILEKELAKINQYLIIIPLVIGIVWSISFKGLYYFLESERGEAFVDLLYTTSPINNDVLIVILVIIYLSFFVLFIPYWLINKRFFNQKVNIRVLILSSMLATIIGVFISNIAYFPRELSAILIYLMVYLVYAITILKTYSLLQFSWKEIIITSLVLSVFMYAEVSIMEVFGIRDAFFYLFIIGMNVGLAMILPLWIATKRTIRNIPNNNIK